MQNLAVKELQMNNWYHKNSEDIKPNIQWNIDIIILKIYIVHWEIELKYFTFITNCIKVPCLLSPHLWHWPTRNGKAGPWSHTTLSTVLSFLATRWTTQRRFQERGWSSLAELPSRSQVAKKWRGRTLIWAGTNCGRKWPKLSRKNARLGVKRENGMETYQTTTMPPLDIWPLVQIPSHLFSKPCALGTFNYFTDF